MTEPYLHYIRKHIGHERIFLVYAAALIPDEERRLLWQHRADFRTWGLPGGMLELDETLPECLVREVREETGLAVAPVRLVGVYSSPDFNVTYPNGDQVQQVTFAFECRVVGGELQVGDGESLGLAWRSTAQKPGEETPGVFSHYRAMVEDWTAGRPGATFRQGRAGERGGVPPFYQILRPHLGTSPFILPAAAGFVLDESGRLLLQRRLDTGEWGLPGGGMELGERIDSALVSELEEETGLVVEPEGISGVYSGASLWWTYPNGDVLKVVSTVFRCRVTGGELKADGVESLEVAFFERDALPPVPTYLLSILRDGFDGQAEAAY